MAAELLLGLGILLAVVLGAFGGTRLLNVIRLRRATPPTPISGTKVGSAYVVEQPAATEPPPPPADLPPVLVGDVEPPVSVTNGQPPEPDKPRPPRMTHEEARAILRAAFVRVFSRLPTLPELQAIQAVALCESSYGRGFPLEAHNWGAITAPCASGSVAGGDCLCKPGDFGHGDSKRDDDGKLVGYTACFKGYPSDDAGAEGLVRTAYQKRPEALAAAARGDLMGFSSAMYGYYLGTEPGPTKAARKAASIAAHAKWIGGGLATIAQAHGERVAVGPRLFKSPEKGGMAVGIVLVASPLALALASLLWSGRAS